MSILPPFPSLAGKIGMTICFDLRFPEINLSLKRQGAEVIVYPSAFTVPTGLAHWKPLLQARAIESQAYVIAAAQSGRHHEKRVSYGHSLVASPWGEVLAELPGAEHHLDKPGEPDLAVIDIDLEYVQKVRRDMPLLRRTDVYREV